MKLYSKKARKGGKNNRKTSKYVKNNRKNTKRQRGGVKKSATYKNPQDYYDVNPDAATAPSSVSSFFMGREKIGSVGLNKSARVLPWYPGIKGDKGIEIMRSLPEEVSREIGESVNLGPSSNLKLIFGDIPTEENGLIDEPLNRLNRIYKLSIQYVIQIANKPNIQKFNELLNFFKTWLNHPDKSKKIQPEVYLEIANYIKKRLIADKYAIGKILGKINESFNITEMPKKHLFFLLNNYIANLYNFLRFYAYLSCPKNRNGEPIDSSIPIPNVVEWRSGRDSVYGTSLNKKSIYVQKMPLNLMNNIYLLKDYKMYEKMKTEGITPNFFWMAHHYMTSATGNLPYDFINYNITNNTMLLYVTIWENDINNKPLNFLLNSKNDKDLRLFYRRLMLVMARKWNLNGLRSEQDRKLYKNALSILTAVESRPEWAALEQQNNFQAEDDEIDQQQEEVEVEDEQIELDEQQENEVHQHQHQLELDEEQQVDEQQEHEVHQQQEHM
jgi:hypothetical protein